MKKILEKIGLSNLQSDIYLALLAIGKSGVNDIAKECKTYRANVYDALERLQDLGFVTYVHENKKKIYIPTDPKNFQEILTEIEEKRQKEFNLLKKDMISLIPNLTKKYNSLKEKEEIEIYKGRDGYRAMMRDYMRENFKSGKIFGQLNSMKYFEFEWKKWSKHYLNFKMIVPNTPETKKRAKTLEEHIGKDVIKFKFAPKETYSPTSWAIGGDEIFAIIIWSKNPTVITIRSKEVVKMYSNHFDMLWNAL